MSSMTDKTTSFRFTNIDKTLLKKLSEHLGISQTAVVKLALRRLAKQEGISVKRSNEEHV